VTPLDGRCRDCYVKVDTISDVCPRHEIDDRAHALRLLGKSYRRDVVFEMPGRLVVTTLPAGGKPWIEFAIMPKPSYAFGFMQPSIRAVSARRVILDAKRIGYRSGGDRHYLFVYARGDEDEQALDALFYAWERDCREATPGTPTGTGDGT